MNRDDDSFLSAYLDGQLDPEQRQRVESAVVSDPELADKLRSLTSLRDLVASLNRDFPIDVTARVMGRMRARHLVSHSARTRLDWLRTPYFGWRADLTLGIAASLLLCVTLGMALFMVRLSSRPVRTLVDWHSVSDGASGKLAARTDSGRTVGDPATRSAQSAIESTEDEVPGSGSGTLPRGEGAPLVEAIAISDQARMREQYQKLLDNPRERRLFRVSDGGDGKAVEQVASVVKSSTSFGFYKINISLGIVIDPRHPEEATVYAALVSAKGLDTLRYRLAQTLPDRVEESPIEPTLVTQLADIGQVQAFQSAPFGDVYFTREGLAFPLAPHEQPPAGDAGIPARAEQPTVEQYRSAPLGAEIANRLTSRPAGGGVASDAVKPGGKPAKEADALSGASTAKRAGSGEFQPASGAVADSPRREPREDTFVVLIWVARPHRG